MKLIKKGSGRIYKITEHMSDGEYIWEYAIELNQGKILLIGTDYDDGYRSYMVEKEMIRLHFLYVEKELLGECKDLEIYEGRFEWKEKKDESSSVRFREDITFVVGDGYVIGEYYTSNSDEWYPTSVISFDFDKKKTLEEYTKGMRFITPEEEGKYEFPETLSKNGKVCYVVTGEPRTGKTTSMLHMKMNGCIKDVCDTDMFTRPIEAAEYITEGTAFVIGKHRNVKMEAEENSYTYAEFLIEYIKRLGYEVLILDFEEREELKENQVYTIFMTYDSNVSDSQKEVFPYGVEQGYYHGNKVKIHVRNG